MNEIVEKFSIFLVDDHPAMREGLGLWIDRQVDMVMCGEADDATTAMALIEMDQPDVMVVDLSLRDSDGIDLIRWVHDRYPEIMILVCSMHPEKVYARMCLKSGARGYISKQATTEQIIEAVRQVAQGKFCVSDEMKEELISYFISDKKNGDVTKDPITGELSRRELQVFQHIGEGLTSVEIAARIHISANTVETYRQRIKTKLRIKNNTELITKATQWVWEQTRKKSD